MHRSGFQVAAGYARATKGGEDGTGTHLEGRWSQFLPTSLLLVVTGCRMDRLEENEGKFAEAWIKSLSVASLRDQSKGKKSTALRGCDRRQGLVKSRVERFAMAHGHVSPRSS